MRPRGYFEIRRNYMPLQGFLRDGCAEGVSSATGDWGPQIRVLGTWIVADITGDNPVKESRSFDLS